MNLRPAHLLCLPLWLVLACGKESAAPATEPEAPAAATDKGAPAAAPAAPTQVGLEAPADPNEACGQVLVVSYKGAEHAADTVTRDKAAAQARAADLVKTALVASDFAALAKQDSDAPSSGPRGGIMGTYTKDAWPEMHAAMKDALFALQVNETAAQVVEAPYGFVIVHRCKVEKAHARHVLVRYKGAKKAGPEIKRSKDEARKVAVEVQIKLSQGGDFTDIAKKYSEDDSKKRGGDIGTVGRGLLAPAFEDTLFALKIGELSTVVETDFGFHVIQRLPEEVPAMPAPAAPAPSH